MKTVMHKDLELEARMRAEMAARRAEMMARLEQLPAIRAAGEEALRRLLPIAMNDTGQASVIARFLLSMYNGERFPFDLTDLRRLDHKLHDDCLTVLRMDHQPYKEVHRYFEDGGELFEKIARNWGFQDHRESWK